MLLFNWLFQQDEDFETLFRNYRKARFSTSDLHLTYYFKKH